MAVCSGVVVVGMSAGGLKALRALVQGLTDEFAAPVALAQHMGPSSIMPQLISWWTRRPAMWAVDGEALQPGVIHVCAPGSHVAITPDLRLAVSARPRLRFVRPSIDWLFESAAASFGARAIAVALSGANGDGARGASAVERAGGLVIIQDPATADYATMPLAVAAQTRHAQICRPAELSAAVCARVRLLEQVHIDSWWEFSA